MNNGFALPNGSHYIEINALPAVNQIISDAEEKLSAICGSKVTVLIKVPNKEEINLLAIQRHVCDAFDVSWSDVASKSRKKSDNRVYARFAYCYLCRQFLAGLSLKSIAETIHRDHTTVIHAVGKVQDYLDTNDKVIAPMVGIIATLMSNERVKTAS